MGILLMKERNEGVHFRGGIRKVLGKIIGDIIAYVLLCLGLHNCFVSFFLASICSLKTLG